MYIINKGFWSSKIKKKLHILNKRPQSSSMYEPEFRSFDFMVSKKKIMNYLRYLKL